MPFIQSLLLNTLMKWHTMKTLLLISLFFLDSLPPESQLYAALDSFYQYQTTANLTEYQSTTKKRWLKFLPSVGLSYNLKGQPRPTISWSSNLIYTSFKNKESKAAKQRSIIQKKQLLHQKDQLKLAALLQKYYALKQDISFQKKLYAYDSQLYEVQQDQAQHLEISPVELLKATQNYEKKAYDIFQNERKLKELEWEILIQAHYIH